MKYAQDALQDMGMKYWTQFIDSQLKNAIWHLKDGRQPLRGGYTPSVDQIRAELKRRGLSGKGFHEDK